MTRKGIEMARRVMIVRRVVAAALVVALLGVAPAIASAQTASQTVVVEIFDNGFKPASNTVAPGTVNRPGFAGGSGY